MIDKKRIEILEKAKKQINNDYYWFICEALEDLIDAETRKFVFKVFPELKKHKPKNKLLDGAWWNAEDKKSRIKVLNSMITEIKAKSND